MTDEQFQAYLQQRARVLGIPSDTEPTVAAPQKKRGIWDMIKGSARSVGEAVAPLGKVLGQSMAVREASKMQEQNDAQKQQYINQIMQRLQTTKEPERRAKLIQTLQQLTGKQLTVQEQTPGYNTTGKQVAGAAIVTGLNALSGGMPKGIPAAGAGVRGGLTARLGYETAVGGLYGAGGAAQEGLEGKDYFNRVKTGAAFGLGAGLAGEALQGTARFIKNRAAVKAERALGVPASELQVREFSPGMPKVGEELLSTNPRGNPTQLVEQGRKGMEVAGRQLESALAKHGDKVIPRSQIDEIALEYLDNLPPAQTNTNWLKKLDQMPKNMTPAQANTWKQTFADLAYGTTKGKRITAPVSGEQREFYRVIADTLRESIDDVTGDAAIRAANKQWKLNFQKALWASYKAADVRVGGSQSIGPSAVATKLHQKTIASTRPELFKARLYNRIGKPAMTLSEALRAPMRASTVEGSKLRGPQSTE